MIVNENRLRQIVDFDSIKFGNIQPTDIDGVLEYHNKAYILLEFKCGDACLSQGQSIALTRMVDDLSKVKHAVLFVARHRTPVDKTVDAGSCIVTDYYWHGEWYKAEVPLREIMETYIKYMEVVS